MPLVPSESIKALEIDRTIFVEFHSGTPLNIEYDHKPVPARNPAAIVMPEGAHSFIFTEKVSIKFEIDGLTYDISENTDDVKLPYLQDSIEYFPGGQIVDWEDIPDDAKNKLEFFHQKRCLFIKTRTGSFAPIAPGEERKAQIL